MSEQLFREIADPTVRVRRSTGRTVVLSILIHTALLIALVVVPLMATGTIPSPRSVMLYVAPPTLPTPPPPAPPPQTPLPQTPVDLPDPTAAPAAEPSRITDPPMHLPAAGTPTMSGAAMVPWTGVPGGVSTITTPPPPPPPPPPVQPQRVGGDIREPTKVHHVNPVYPQIAVAAKVDGVVIIEATIGRDGTIIDAKVVRSVALLDQAALDAVRQWRFTPTRLNGVPIPVIMTVTVRFTLR